MNNKQSIGSLESEGLVTIPYPPKLRKAVEKAVASWRQFCMLGEAQRSQFPYNHETNMGVGYELKKVIGANRDLKEDFHFTSGARKWLLDTAQTIKEPAILQFVNDANALSKIVAPLILDFAANVEETFSLPGFLHDVKAGEETWFIRFLHYFGGRQEGDEIATPHADKSGFTLHLYESDPGLQHLTFDKQWKDMPVSEGETVIIPGMRLQYRSENKLKGVYHRVVATEKTAREGRFSVVCFIHPKNTKEYNKQKAGRLQEFHPGFNYEMPFEEFAKLFI